MTFLENIFNPFIEKVEDNTELSRLIRDCRNLEFYKIFSSKNQYHNTNEFKLLYSFSEILFIFCKKGLEILKTNKLERFIDFLLEDLKIKMKLRVLDIIIYSLYLFQGLILRENWVGPKFIPNKFKSEFKTWNVIYYDKIKNFSDIFDEINIQISDFENWNFSEIFEKQFIYNEELFWRDYLSIDGEGYQKKFGYKNIFILKTKILEILHRKEKLKDNLNIVLLLARSYNLHSKILSNPTMTLKKQIQNLYGTFLTNYRRNLNFSKIGNDIKFYSFVKLEFALILLNYYKYKNSKKIILETMSLLGIEVNFKGKYDIKTTSNNFNMREFTVEINHKNNDSFRSTQDHSQHKKCKRKIKTRKSFSNKRKKPTIKKLCEIFDNILEEKPHLEDYAAKKNISLEENIVILALITNMMKANPMDEILREKIMAFLNKSIETFNNWSVLLTALNYRSKLEFAIPNKRERAMIQYEEIVKDWHSKEGFLYERVKYIFFLNFPIYNKLIKNIADSYVSINCFNTANSLLMDYELYSEALEITKYADKKFEIENVIKQIPPICYNHPEIHCKLGDIYNDSKYYYKALELSDNKCKKAFLSLGLYYLKMNNLDKSLSNFQQAFSLNEFCIQAWNNTGYIYMQRKEFDSAILCYTKSISLIDTQSEIWGNLSILYRFQNNLSLSFKAISKAISLNDKNWKLWSNYLIVAWEIKNYEEYIRAIWKLIVLEHPEEIEDVMIKRINYILQVEYSDFNKAENVKLTDKINKRFFK